MLFLSMCHLMMLLPSFGQLCEKQGQSSRGVLKKTCSENIHQIYRRSPMPSNLIETTSASVFPCKFAAYFQNILYQEHLWTAASGKNGLFIHIFLKKYKWMSITNKLHYIEFIFIHCSLNPHDWCIPNKLSIK